VKKLSVDPSEGVVRFDGYRYRLDGLD
jgi:hypothetical protein